MTLDLIFIEREEENLRLFCHAKDGGEFLNAKLSWDCSVKDGLAKAVDNAFLGISEQIKPLRGREFLLLAPWYTVAYDFITLPAELKSKLRLALNTEIKLFYKNPENLYIRTKKVTASGLNAVYNVSLINKSFIKELSQAAGRHGINIKFFAPEISLLASLCGVRKDRQIIVADARKNHTVLAFCKGGDIIGVACLPAGFQGYSDDNFVLGDKDCPQRKSTASFISEEILTFGKNALDLGYLTCLDEVIFCAPESFALPPWGNNNGKPPPGFVKITKSGGENNPSQSLFTLNNLKNISKIHGVCRI